MLTVFYVEKEVSSTADLEVRPVNSKNVVVMIVYVEFDRLWISSELLKRVDERSNALVVALCTRELDVTFGIAVEDELTLLDEQRFRDFFTKELLR